MQTDAEAKNNLVTFKNCAPITGYIIKINNTQVDNGKDPDVVMPMYYLIENSNNHGKISGSLWQYHKVDSNGNITDSESFKFRARTIGRTPAADNTKDAKIVVSLNNFLNICKTLEMPLINCETNLMLTWSENWKHLQQQIQNFTSQ